jgi:hypothetical protein
MFAEALRGAVHNPDTRGAGSTVTSSHPAAPTRPDVPFLCLSLKRFNFGFAVEMSKNADRSRKSTGKRKVSAL